MTCSVLIEVSYAHSTDYWIGRFHWLLRLRAPAARGVSGRRARRNDRLLRSVAKQRRLDRLLPFEHFRKIEGYVETPGLLMELLASEKPGVVVHLAAQAGVPYSIENPRSYLESNIVGTFELLEAARAHPPGHMLLASTSSVFEANTQMPYRETDKADHQMSFYAATKKATENMAHSYAHLFDLPVTMFRFFTVYGPWGRPDMALFKFTKAILEGHPIDVYNYGDMKRDFTYIEDLVDAIHLLIDTPPLCGPQKAKRFQRVTACLRLRRGAWSTSATPTQYS